MNLGLSRACVLPLLLFACTPAPGLDGGTEDESAGTSESGTAGTDTDTDTGTEETGTDTGEPPPEPLMLPDVPLEPGECSSTPGGLVEACADEPCPVLFDHVIACPEGERAYLMELAISQDRALVDLEVSSPSEDAGFPRSLIVEADAVHDVEPFPGVAFTSQTNDGAVLRSMSFNAGETPTYLERVDGGWLQHVVDIDAEAELDLGVDFNVELQPMARADDSMSFAAGRTPPSDDDDSSTVYWIDGPGPDNWLTTLLVSEKPDSGPIYVGTDALDRVYTFGRASDWWPETDQIFVGFLGDALTPLGPHAPYPGYEVVVAPPRPAIAVEPAIAVLRGSEMGTSLELLTIHDSDDLGAFDVDAQLLIEECPNKVDVPDDQCPPPCHQEVGGIAANGYALARTGDGRLWALWIHTELITDTTYELAFSGTCKGTRTGAPSGELHVAELAQDGAFVRSISLPLGAITNPSAMVVAAFDQRVGVLINQPDEAMLRVLSLDVDAI
ncbi:hypothetical protein ENSA5_15390 [Enhygromyxa salina]|uniref:Uncharacterized protein n=1 Tax=Enhygromyxa salina TaxID=215803 RepID=A0A2S9YEH2_9BACT|nr:hypothetical protein [Enhygromyxa salina]PRQ03509.1 hypothetical protein ENSA5_15390 [Enhygromyxa salina]